MKYIFFLLLAGDLLASDGFKAAKIIKKENVSAEGMIVIAYIAFFILILGYILFISRKINLVSKKLRELESLKE